MDDEKIIDLYFQRDEMAIQYTDQKYGKNCYYVANNILGNHEDSEECVSDTYQSVWNDIPPTYPRRFLSYLLKITRNLSINKVLQRNAQKRGNGKIMQFLDELNECIPSKTDDPLEELKYQELKDTIQSFVDGLNEQEGAIFIQRYFFLEDTKVIAQKYHMKKSNVLNILSRTRKKLKDYLIERGYDL